MSLIKKPNELAVQQIVKILIYGQPGIGKTTLGLSAPKPLLLDFDGGVHRVNPLHQKDTVQVQKWEDVIDVLNEDLTAYKSLTIDTAGKMLDFMNAYIIKNDPKLGKRDGSITLQGYGARKVMFKNFLAKVSGMGKNIIFIAHDKEDKKDETVFIRPEVGGSSGGDLMKELDLVGYVEASGKLRTISFDPCERFYGKNTCQLENIIQVPILTGSDNNFLTDIIAINTTKQQDRVGMVSDYEDLMHLINTNAKDCLTPEECNTFVEWIGTVEHIWDSKQQAAVIINNAAKTLGLIYDKEIKGYRSKDIQHPAPEAAVKTVGVTPKTETPTPAAEAKTPVQKAAEFANKAAAKKAETQTAMEVVNV